MDDAAVNCNANSRNLDHERSVHATTRRLRLFIATVTFPEGRMRGARLLILENTEADLLAKFLTKLTRRSCADQIDDVRVMHSTLL
jgi:hypothetical protein